MAPSNLLVIDAVDRLEERNPDKKIVHIRPMAVEQANIFIKDPTPPQSAQTDHVLTRQESLLINHLHQTRVKKYNMLSPAADHRSLSERTKVRILADPKRYALLIQAMHNIEFDKDSFTRNISEYKEAARAAMDDEIQTCDAIVATAVAIGKFANYFTWKPDLVVVDETGRFSEAAALIVPSKYPDAACIFVGDPKQLGPICKTVETPWFSHIFGHQRKTSLLERVSYAGQCDIILRENHRSHGSTADWVRDTFYFNDMNIYHPESQYTTGIREHMQRYVDNDLDVNFMWFNVRDATEQQIGTSYNNPAQARFVVELIVKLKRAGVIPNMADVTKKAIEDAKKSEQVDQKPNPIGKKTKRVKKKGKQIDRKSEQVDKKREQVNTTANGVNQDTRIGIGDVLIITGYSHQKSEYETLISQLSPAEITPGSVTVRTIDDSQSKQAAVVIIDFVRTTQCGFMNDDHRLAVALSRAQILNIVVASDQIVPFRGPLALLHAYAIEKEALVKVGRKNSSWGTWCAKCLRPGHELHECQFEVECAGCRAADRPCNHAARYCNNPEPVVGYYGDVLPALDNVHRDIFTDNSKSVQKRVKIRNVKRHARKFPPSAKSDAAQRAFNAARPYEALTRPADDSD